MSRSTYHLHPTTKAQVQLDRFRACEVLMSGGPFSKVTREFPPKTVIASVPCD